jgi:uncharacterized membrane protein
VKRTSLIAALYLLLTFCTGAAVGGFAVWTYQARTVRADVRRSTADDYRKRYLREMESRLKLTPDQMSKLVGILDNTRTVFRELSEKHKPEFDAVHQAQREQVRALLDDAQKAEYEKLVRERDARRKGRPGPPGL